MIQPASHRRLIVNFRTHQTSDTGAVSSHNVRLECARAWDPFLPTLLSLSLSLSLPLSLFLSVFCSFTHSHTEHTHTLPTRRRLVWKSSEYWGATFQVVTRRFTGVTSNVQNVQNVHWKEICTHQQVIARENTNNCLLFNEDIEATAIQHVEGEVWGATTVKTEGCSFAEMTLCIFSFHCEWNEMRSRRGEDFSENAVFTSRRAHREQRGLFCAYIFCRHRSTTRLWKKKTHTHTHTHSAHLRHLLVLGLRRHSYINSVKPEDACGDYSGMSVLFQIHVSLV